MRGLYLVSTMMLVTVLTCSACGPTVVEVTATPTNTPVPPTPTATPTATPTPLPTAKPTPIPVASATPRPGLTTVLVLEDLPPGFQAIPPEEMGFTSDLFGEELVVGSTFCFIEAQNFEVILGLTVVFDSRLDQFAFDLELAESEVFLESFVEGFAQHEPIRDRGELPDVGEIGDASAAYFVVSDTDIPLQIDMVEFRRGDVGVFVFSVYIHGDEPVAPIAVVARQMDARILAALPPGD